MPRRSNRRRVSPRIWWRPGCAAGCCAQGLSGGDHLPFTQEYLGQMLGVRRTSVTAVAHSLQEDGLIKYARGKIQILDAERLQESACECYGSVKSLYQRLIGP